VVVRFGPRVLNGELSNVDHTYRMRHAEGHWIWVRVQGEAVVTSTDEQPHLVGICIDVSDQIPFVLWDSKNRLVVCNEKYRELNQIKPELAVPGAPYSEVMNSANGPQPITMNAETTDSDVKNRSFETALSDGRWLQINEHRTDDGLLSMT